MRSRISTRVLPCVACVLALVAPAAAQTAPETPLATTTQRTLEEWVRLLGAESYQQREEATRALLAMEPGIAAQLQKLHDADSDPERRYRLRYILENIVPPDQAILVLRTGPDSPLMSGDLITQINARRVRTVAELLRARAEGGEEMMMRVNGPDGPREIPRVRVDDRDVFSNYRAPRGEPIVRAVRLFASGFAEQAHELLDGLGDAVPEEELSPVLRARIAYVAGDARTALRLLEERASVVRPGGRNQWQDPSPLDLCAPGRAPFRLEWELWSRATSSGGSNFDDPDLRVQRVLSAARRYIEALAADARYWKDLYRDTLSNDNQARMGGNMLAVCSWMLSDLDLASESMRLIEPRSKILRMTSNLRKWLRVRTEAWLMFLSGHPGEALELFHDDALDVLQRPFADVSDQILRNPRVAGWVAFFLYQSPDDQRIGDMLALVARPQHPGLMTFARAMLFAQTPANHELIRQQFRTVVAVLPQSQMAWGRLSAAALEYAHRTPDLKWLAENTTAYADIANPAERAVPPALLTALELLARNQYAEAAASLADLPDDPIAATLRHTAGFLANPPAGVANQPGLRSAIAAVPEGDVGEGVWIVITRDGRLVRVAGGRLEPLDKPSATWLPGAVNFPWLGRDEGSGRVWCYDRRRVIELTHGIAVPLRMTIRSEDIPVFHRLIGPMFDTFARAVIVGATLDPLTPDGVRYDALSNETGEYLRNDILANSEFVGDPDLPELGVLSDVSSGSGFWHAALRGGVHFLIRERNGKFVESWSSVWMRDQLGIALPPVFFPLAPIGPDATVIHLASDQGLLRLDCGKNAIVRVALPCDPPYPPLVPEHMPYERADRRWVYVARTPRDGGQVFRVALENGRAEALDVRNEALPESYYAVQSRAVIRAEVGRAMREATGMDTLPFILDVANVVNRWAEQKK